MGLIRFFFRLFLPSRRRHSRPTLARPSVKPQTNELVEARTKQITDGDGVIVSISKGLIEVRLFAIDCPEYGQEWGEMAKAGLIKLIGGKKRIYLETYGIDPHGRILATIYVEQDSKLINVNERMVYRGHAWVYRQYYGPLSQDRRAKLDWCEERARQRKAGLWRATHPIPPWEWRRRPSA